MQVISANAASMVSGAGWAEFVVEHAQDIYDGLSGLVDGFEEGYETSGAHKI